MNPDETMSRIEKLMFTLVSLALIGLTPDLLQAQAGTGDIGGLRAYWHVFIAYSIAILLVLGWVISIGRRLRDVEERLGD